MIGRCFLVLLVSRASGACLTDHIPAESRQNILTNDGQPMPIGLFEGAWESSYLMTAIAQILVQEVLGYNTSLNVPGDSAVTTPYALAGCTEYNDLKKQSFALCAERETQIHVSVDSWWASYASVVEAMRSSPEFAYLAPANLGSMGYEGLESIYISDRVLNDALDTNGLILDYYRGFNTSRGNPKIFFEGIENISSSSLRTCDNTDFWVSAGMRDYARWTGDYEGVVVTNDTYVAKCLNEQWWVSPTCRHDPDECIPVITAGSGWKAQAMMHWSTVYGLPTAIGVAKTWGDYVDVVTNHDILFYWWVPDATFVLQRPHSITFPLHVAQEWAEGNMKTAATFTYIAKATSSNFANKAPKVNSFISNFQFELGEVQDLLLEVASGSTSPAVACRWIQDNRARWEDWLPVETNCLTGFGMVDAQGEYELTRANASTCAVCPPGRFSEEVVDKDGATRRCRLCEPGQSQASSATTACEPCAAGTSTKARGASECDVCQQGFYQNAEGQSDCIECSGGRTTRLLRASRVDECVCRADFIEANDGCVACGEGISCPVGSSIQLLLEGGNGTNSPKLLEGYNADPLIPLDIYRCNRHCPGGTPGTCSGSHVGVTCGECPEGTFSNGGVCGECGAGQLFIWIVAIMVFVASILMFHFLLSSPYSAKASVITCTTCGMGMTVALFQNLGILRTVDIPWPQELSDFLAVFKIFLLDLDSLGLSCIMGGPVHRYAGSCLVFFIVVAALASISLLTNWLLPARLSRLKWQKFKVMNTTGQFLQVGFTTMTNVSLVPFVCVRHPSGRDGNFKYDSVFCGSPEHSLMQVFGTCTLLLSLLFLALCFYAGWRAPIWSGTPRMGGIRFLIFRFRPDVWWYGLTLLTRGPLLSLSVVAAPNFPVVQLICLLIIILMSLYVQLWFLPWKAPVLNLVDGITTAQLVVLLALGLGRVTAHEEAVDFLDILASVISASITGLLGLLMVLAGLALIYRKGLGTSKEIWAMNLGMSVENATVRKSIQVLAKNVMRHNDEAEIERALDTLCVYDLVKLNHSVLLLSTELGLSTGDTHNLTKMRITSRGMSSFSLSARISGRISNRVSQVLRPRGSVFERDSDIAPVSKEPEAYEEPQSNDQSEEEQEEGNEAETNDEHVPKIVVPEPNESFWV